MTKKKNELDWRDVRAPSHFGFAEAAAAGGQVTGFNQGSFYSGPEPAARELINHLRGVAENNIEVKDADHSAAIRHASKRISTSFDEFAALVGPLRHSQPNEFNSFHEAIFALMNSAGILGTSVQSDQDLKKLMAISGGTARGKEKHYDAWKKWREKALLECKRMLRKDQNVRRASVLKRLNKMFPGLSVRQLERTVDGWKERAKKIQKILRH